MVNQHETGNSSRSKQTVTDHGENIQNGKYKNINDTIKHINNTPKKLFKYKKLDTESLRSRSTQTDPSAGTTIAQLKLDT